MNRARLGVLAARALHDLAAAQSAMLVCLGERLGLYRAMRGSGPLTPAELARRTGTDPRYVEEWLVNQAASGWVECDAAGGRFELSPEQAALFADEESPQFQGAAYQLCLALVPALESLEAAFRSGQGLTPSSYPAEVGRAVRRTSGVRTPAALLQDWIPAMPGLEERLREGGRAADVGCGSGAAALALARSFEGLRVEGFDLDPEAVRAARAAALSEGLQDRVGFELTPAAGLPGRGYALVLAVDVLHEVGAVEPVLEAIREALAPGGALLLVEPYAGEDLAARLHPWGRLLSAVSALHCLPLSRAEGGPGRGALVREAELRDRLAGAGFGSVAGLQDDPFHLALDCRIRSPE